MLFDDGSGKEFLEIGTIVSLITVSKDHSRAS